MKNAAIGGLIGIAAWIVIWPWLIMSPLARWYSSYAEWVYVLFR